VSVLREKMIDTRVSCGVALFQKNRPRAGFRVRAEIGFSAGGKRFSTAAQGFIR
jgi:hypothetical protein